MFRVICVTLEGLINDCSLIWLFTVKENMEIDLLVIGKNILNVCFSVKYLICELYELV